MEQRLSGAQSADKGVIGVDAKAEDREFSLLPPASLVQEILLGQQSIGHGLASLGSREDKGERSSLRKRTSELDLVAGDPGLNPVDDPDAAGHAAPAGEDEMLPFPGQRLRQPTDVQDVPVAKKLSVDAQFSHEVRRRLGAIDLAEGER